ncbi:MAG TPA: hypothetical protein VNA22_08795 [Pyrinomonadaceae bacterium]|nr:hypothetical protein [Pyrinomonadaceae bacterium]
MEEVFSVEHRDDHIHVQVTPDIEVSDRARGEFWDMIRKICLERDCHRMLVEGSFPTGERPATEVVSAGKATATVPNMWIAFHIENWVPNEQSELFEAVAASRGVRVKYFDNSEAALNWLRTNAPK